MNAIQSSNLEINPISPRIIDGRYESIKVATKKPLTDKVSKVTKSKYFTPSNALSDLRSATSSTKTFMRICSENTFTPEEIRSFSFGCSMLTIASYSGSLEVVKKLVSLGADGTPGTQTTLPNTPLSAASHNGYVKVVRFLLKNGADLEDSQVDKNFFENTPLGIACLNGHYAAAKALLEYGANPHGVKNSQKPICNALQKGNVKIVHLLLSYGASLHECGDMHLLVTYAAMKGFIELQAFLIHRANLDVNYRNPENGNTALFEAYACGKTKSVKFLQAMGADTKIKNTCYETYRQHARRLKHTEAFVALKEAFQSAYCRKAIWENSIDDLQDINAKDSVGNTLLHFAVEHPKKNQEWIKKLLKHKANPDLVNNKYLTPYNLLLRKRDKLIKLSNNEILIKELLELSNIMLKKSDEQVQTFNDLIWQISRTRFSFNKRKHIAHKIANLNDINTLTHDGKNLLEIAISQSTIDIPIVLQLLSRGINYDIKTKKDLSFLDTVKQSFKFTEFSRRAILKIIEAKNVNIPEQTDIVDQLYKGFIDRTINEVDWKKVDEVINVNHFTTSGDTLLSAALKDPIKNIDFICDLHNRCADPRINNKDNRTPIDSLIEAMKFPIVNRAINNTIDLSKYSPSKGKQILTNFLPQIITHIRKSIIANKRNNL